jgi:hypothetical protein
MWKTLIVRTSFNTCKFVGGGIMARLSNYSENSINMKLFLKGLVLNTERTNKIPKKKYFSKVWTNCKSSIDEDFLEYDIRE